MMFQQQKQDNCENENEDCKNTMISTKNKTVNDKTIITAAILQLIVQQYLLLYSLNTILFYYCKIKEDTWCGYVVVYSSKIKHMCIFAEDDIQCDVTILLYILPLCI